MRLLAVPLVLGLCAAPAFPADVRGVHPEDVDTSADPCSDFFQYANGRWRQENAIPASQSRWSRRWQAGETAKDQLKVILDEVSARSTWPRGSVEQLVGDHYAACMDEAKIEALGAEPVRPLLADIDRVEDARGVQRALARLHGLGVNALFAISSSPGNHDPTRTILDVRAAGLGLPDRDYYVKTEARFQEARERYRAHVARMFELAGSPAAVARAAAESVLATETQLALASLDNVALRDPQATDHLTTFAALGALTPRFEWGPYFDALGVAHADLNVQEPKFLQAVDRQLVELPIASWRTYLKWAVIRDSAPSLSRAFADESFDFNGRFLEGRKEQKPRWKRCVESTDALLGEALGQKYVERHFPPAAKKRAREMVDNLLWAMGDTIKGLPWMSAPTKAKALEKLATFNPKIGYPDAWKDYASVAIRRDAFFANQGSATSWNVKDDLRHVGKPTDRGLWGMTPPTSNAYYNPLLNEIVFPAGILQPPSFDVAATDAVNYGAIGVVIGHEISHGFDDQGAQYDAQGRLQNWWSDADLQQFQQKTQCVVDQFEGYFVEPGLHHNGKLVLGESIGDLAGAKIAFKAYQHSREGKGAEPTIAGFTPEQQFFVAWGQWRGDATRPETARLMVQNDPHPTGQYRVVGPLSNLPEFRQAFACKADAPMVRPDAKRCEVW
jgi:putative endopeptidase